MTSTPSAVLGVELQGQNDNTGAWWANANQIFQSFEDAIAKEVALATTGGDTALSVASYSVDQARCQIIRVGAGQTLLSLVRVTTARARLYFVTNETIAGAFALQFGGNNSNLVTITRGCGAWVRVRSDSTTTFAGPLVNLTTGAIDGASLASGAFLIGANNLSDVANAATARAELGLAIGVNVQAYDADLTAWAGVNPSSYLTTAQIAAAYQPLDADLATWAGLTPSANAQSLVTAADYAAMRTLLSLVYAAQADMETPASSALVVPPALVKNHPGVAKAWVVYNLATPTVIASHNVTSVVRDSTGVFTTTFTVPFSSANYSFHGTAEGSGFSNGLTVVGKMSGHTRTANVCQLWASTTSGTAFDSAYVCVNFFGDQ